jgi:hypothetical protein
MEILKRYRQGSTIMKSSIKQNKVSILIVGILICLGAVLFFSWESLPIYFPDETKKIILNADKDNLEAALYIDNVNSSSTPVIVHVYDSAGKELTPYKSGKNNGYEDWFTVGSGQKYKITTTNKQKSIIMYRLKAWINN